MVQRTTSIILTVLRLATQHPVQAHDQESVVAGLLRRVSFFWSRFSDEAWAANSWVFFWSRFSDEAWADYCHGYCGYGRDEWLWFFQSLSMLDWWLWQAQYLAELAFARLMWQIFARAHSRL